MANEQNLIPISERTSSELREMTRKGGIASGETRRRQRQIREDLDYMLSIIDKKTGKTNQEMISEAIMAKALSGDVRAFETIRDTVGEKPDQNMIISADVGLSAEDRALLIEANKLYATRT